MFKIFDRKFNNNCQIIYIFLYWILNKYLII